MTIDKTQTLRPDASAAQPRRKKETKKSTPLPLAPAREDEVKLSGVQAPVLVLETKRKSHIDVEE